MRIIAGEMRSRPLLAPRGVQTRPTQDYVRESLFNIIAADCPDARVLDLFAGSGALALEAISRGAAFAALCDVSGEAIRVIRRNIQSLGVADKTEAYLLPDKRAVALLSGLGRRFDLVFLDPPYRMDASPVCARMADAGILLGEALIVIEHTLQARPQPDARFRLCDHRQYRGETCISFYRYAEGT